FSRDDLVAAMTPRPVLQALEHMGGRAPQLQRGLGGHRLDVGRAEDAIGSENSFRRAHDLGGKMTCTSAGSTRTSAAPAGTATSMRALSSRAVSTPVKSTRARSSPAPSARMVLASPRTVTST